jgi:hypothetical protein
MTRSDLRKTRKVWRGHLAPRTAGVRLEVGEKKRWSGLEFRNPNPEIRKKSEIRNPNAALDPFQLNSQSDLRKTA